MAFLSLDVAKKAGFKILRQNTTSMIDVDGSLSKGICIIAMKKKEADRSS